MPTLHKPVFVKARDGLKVRKEDGTYLPAEGDTVIHSSFWARRERDGDVELSDLPDGDIVAEAPAKSKTTSKAGS